MFRQKIAALLSTLALCCAGVASCSSEDVIEPSAQNVDEPGTYFILNIPIDDSSTRAENEAESSEEYNGGISDEYKVNKAYVYFFDQSGNPVQLSDGKLYLELSMTYVSGSQSVDEMPTGTSYNIGKGYTSGLQEVDKKLQMNTKYRMYVLCNIPITTTFTSLDQFLDMQQTGDYATYGMPMASRDSQGKTYHSFSITRLNTETNPVNFTVYVERALARITYASTATTFTLYESASSTTSLGKVTLTDMVVFNKHNKWYTFRHVGNIDSNYNVTIPTDESRFGIVDTNSSTTPFVIDPYTKDKNASGSKAQSIYTDWFGNFTTWHTSWAASEAISAATSSSNPTVIDYLPENVMYTDAQIRNQATGVLIRAKITPTKVTYASSYSYSTYETSNYSGDLYYYPEDGKFYASIRALQLTYLKLSITSSNYSSYGVKRYVDGYGYYLYYIRHDDNQNNEVMGAMEFAIVRNNSYDLKVQKVAMTPYSDDDIPDLPSDDPVEEDIPVEAIKAYIKITITVRPWTLRSQSGDLK